MLIAACPFCGEGRLARKRVDVVKRGIFAGQFEAEECGNCGEQIFDENEAVRIEEKMRKLAGWKSRG